MHLYKTGDQFGLTSVLCDSFDSVFLGIDKDDFIVFQDNDNRPFCKVPAFLPEYREVMYEAIRRIVMMGGEKAAKEIGFFSADKMDEALEHISNLHFKYAMPKEAHLQHMIRKNPRVIHLIRSMDLHLV